MARKSGKQYQAAQKQVEAKDYLLEQAIPLIKKIKFAKFDETVEAHMRLGVDPKHADQMVRGTVVLPHALGKSKIVAVIASGDKIIKVKVCTRCLNAGKVKRAPRGQAVA